mmetsp:Transcript_102374/g.289524  ORF Transcript_102374/g.289524 Transcript_102374/m.289524 type:complete len:211 (-) Transcript_102374:548-1180(-)
MRSRASSGPGGSSGPRSGRPGRAARRPCAAWTCRWRRARARSGRSATRCLTGVSRSTGRARGRPGPTWTAAGWSAPAPSASCMPSCSRTGRSRRSRPCGWTCRAVSCSAGNSPQRRRTRCCAPCPAPVSPKARRLPVPQQFSPALRSSGMPCMWATSGPWSPCAAENSAMRGCGTLPATRSYGMQLPSITSALRTSCSRRSPPGLNKVWT